MSNQLKWVVFNVMFLKSHSKISLRSSGTQTWLKYSPQCLLEACLYCCDWNDFRAKTSLGFLFLLQGYTVGIVLAHKHLHVIFIVSSLFSSIVGAVFTLSKRGQCQISVLGLEPKKSTRTSSILYYYISCFPLVLPFKPTLNYFFTFGTIFNG